MVSYSASNSEKCLKGLLRELMILSILKTTFCDKVRESFNDFLTEDLVLYTKRNLSVMTELDKCEMIFTLILLSNNTQSYFLF